MWRRDSVHERGETEYLDSVIARLERDTHLFKHAESFLEAVEEQEPLIAESLRTPQDVRYHAEGPFMRDHVRLMLMFLFGLVEEKAHLIDIEEFRRMKGYEGEIDELEELIKENISLFQVFALCHDVAKWQTITFTSRNGFKGEALGFHTPHAHHFDEAAHERAQKRAAYLELYSEFSRTEFRGAPRETQRQFYLVYGIDAHYPGHARKIHAPVFEDVLDRMCRANRLPPRDRDLLDDLIAHHLEVVDDFSQPQPSRMHRYLQLASHRGYDADDYIDLMQGCLLLDMVGSKRSNVRGSWHDPTAFINCLKSEHDWAPYRRAQKEVLRAQEEKKKRNRVLKEVGLDGVALLELLGMEPGAEFGRALRRIHAAILGQGEMPELGQNANQEIEGRTGEFYKRIFQQGE